MRDVEIQLELTMCLSWQNLKLAIPKRKMCICGWCVISLQATRINH